LLLKARSNFVSSFFNFIFTTPFVTADAFYGKGLEKAFVTAGVG
jgi:hypothetical protein